MASAASAETAPWSASTCADTSRLRALQLVGVRHDPADERVAGAGDLGQPRGDHPAGARLRRGERQAHARGRESSTTSSTSARPAGKQNPLQRLGRADARASSARRSAPGSRRRRRGSRSPARRSSVLDPVRVAAGLLGRRAPPSTPPRRRTAAPRRSGGRARASSRRTSSRFERARPEPLELARRAREDDHHAPHVLDDERRRRPGEPHDDGALRHLRLLAHAVLELGIGPPKPLRDRARDRLDLPRAAARRPRAAAPARPRATRRCGRSASGRGRRR